MMVDRKGGSVFWLAFLDVGVAALFFMMLQATYVHHVVCMQWRHTAYNIAVVIVQRNLYKAVFTVDVDLWCQLYNWESNTLLVQDDHRITVCMNMKSISPTKSHQGHKIPPPSSEKEYWKHLAETTDAVILYVPSYGPRWKEMRPVGDIIHVPRRRHREHLEKKL